MQLPFVSCAMELLLRQSGKTDADIRALSFETLMDTDQLSILSLLWTLTGWLWLAWETDWLLPCVFATADIVLFVLKWRMRRGRFPTLPWMGALSPASLPFINIAIIALIGAQIFLLLQAPSERMGYFAFVLTGGFLGYTAAFSAAFPMIAMVHVSILCLSFGVGLALGFSHVARPLALCALPAVYAYWVMIQRIHLTLLGALWNQRDSRLISLHDDLTKLPNRKFLRERLTQHLANLEATQGLASVAVLYMDLDGFKSINDHYGHAAGDDVLVHVAGILREHLGSGATAYRIGGDEFVLLLPDGGEEESGVLGASIVAGVRRPFDMRAARDVMIGASIGVAVASQRNAMSFDELLSNADAALYRAKRAGKNRVHGSAGRLDVAHVGASADLASCLGLVCKT